MYQSHWLLEQEKAIVIWNTLIYTVYIVCVTLYKVKYTVFCNAD